MPGNEKNIYWAAASRRDVSDPNDLFPTARLMVNGLDFAWAYAIFEPIPGFPGYWVGSNGTIWHFRTGSPKPSRKPARYCRLNLKPNSNGYARMSLCRDKQKFERTLHRVVLETFIGPPPDPDMEACHINGKRMDGRLENLRWGTRFQNATDKLRHGTLPFGSAVKTAKLDEDNVAVIKRLLEAKVEHYRIAYAFGVSPTQIASIDKGNSWKRLEKVSLRSLGY